MGRAGYWCNRPVEDGGVVGRQASQMGLPLNIPVPHGHLTQLHVSGLQN
jgi:hypothetical protein